MGRLRMAKEKGPEEKVLRDGAKIDSPAYTTNDSRRSVVDQECAGKSSAGQNAGEKKSRLSTRLISLRGLGEKKNSIITGKAREGGISPGKRKGICLLEKDPYRKKGKSSGTAALIQGRQSFLKKRQGSSGRGGECPCYTRTTSKVLPATDPDKRRGKKKIKTSRGDGGVVRERFLEGRLFRANTFLNKNNDDVVGMRDVKGEKGSNRTVVSSVMV